MMMALMRYMVVVERGETSSANLDASSGPTLKQYIGPTLPVIALFRWAQRFLVISETSAGIK